MTNGRETVRFDKHGFAEFETKFETLIDDVHIGSSSHRMHFKAANQLLTVSEHEGRESYSILNSYEIIHSHVPSGIFPFARTPGGEDLCFDYRGSPEQPRIVLVSVEGSVHPIANSFQEFMDGLYDD